MNWGEVLFWGWAIFVLGSTFTTNHNVPDLMFGLVLRYLVLVLPLQIYRGHRRRRAIASLSESRNSRQRLV
jgi:hypothetical protein